MKHSLCGIISVGTLLLCGSAVPTTQGISSIDVDHRGRAALLRSDIPTPSSPHSANYLKNFNDAAASRYRRGAWGTLECDSHTVPVSDEMSCMDAAAAIGASYVPIGSSCGQQCGPQGCIITRPDMVVTFVLSNQSSSRMTDFPKDAKLCDVGGETTCPRGYDKELGDHVSSDGSEWGDTSLGSYPGGLYADTIDECKDKCGNSTGCLSFKWSPTYTWGQDSTAKLVCILNSVQYPDLQRVWLDFVWCAKTQETINTVDGQFANSNIDATPMANAAASASMRFSVPADAQVRKLPIGS